MKLIRLPVAAFAAAYFPSSSVATPIIWDSGPGHNNHSYEIFLVPGGIDWAAAEANAVSLGGHLASITSADENNFVYSLVSSNPAFWVLVPGGSGIGPWLGGVQTAGSQEPGGGFRWIDGEPFGYTNWAGGEPSNGVGSPGNAGLGIEDRIQLFGAGSLISNKWNDYPASPNTPQPKPVSFIVETVPAVMPSQAGTFSDSLANGRNTDCWVISSTTAGLYSFDDTHGNFSLAKTAMPSPGGLQTVKLALNLAKLGGNINSDFSTHVSFSGAVLPNTSGSSWNQVQFELYFQAGSFFMLRRTTNPNIIDVYSSVHGYVGAVASTASNGTFSCTRTGTMLSGYFNGGLIYAESKSAPLTNVLYRLQNHNTDDAISVAFQNFSLTAKSVVPYLSICSVTDGVEITWPSGFMNSLLEATTNLMPPVLWEGVTNQAEIAAGTMSVTIATDKPASFFRLKQ